MWDGTCVGAEGYGGVETYFVSDDVRKEQLRVYRPEMYCERSSRP